MSRVYHLQIWLRPLKQGPIVLTDPLSEAIVRCNFCSDLGSAPILRPEPSGHPDPPRHGRGRRARTHDSRSGHCHQRQRHRRRRQRCRDRIGHGRRRRRSTRASRYLIPGLWDMHVHFGGGAELIEENKALLPLYVAHGITTVRDASGDLPAAGARVAGRDRRRHVVRADAAELGSEDRRDQADLERHARDGIGGGCRRGDRQAARRSTSTS